MKPVFNIIYVILLVNASLFYLIKLFYLLFRPKFMLKEKLRWFTSEIPTRRELGFYYLAVLLLLISGITTVLDQM